MHAVLQQRTQSARSTTSSSITGPTAANSAAPANPTGATGTASSSTTAKEVLVKRPLQFTNNLLGADSWSHHRGDRPASQEADSQAAAHQADAKEPSSTRPNTAVEETGTEMLARKLAEAAAMRVPSFLQDSGAESSLSPWSPAQKWRQRSPARSRVL